MNTLQLLHYSLIDHEWIDIWDAHCTIYAIDRIGEWNASMDDSLEITYRAGVETHIGFHTFQGR
ncbi:MAG: hypothetical protein ACI9UV_003262 [Algoriphagus sp.]|jgi:hypothetical protein